MLAKIITAIISIARIDLHLKYKGKPCFDRTAGASSTVFIVSTEAAPKVDSLYFPFSILDTSSPRFSR
jgi:hypothetical protein